ncbi:RNA polymerase II transcription elongation factor-domain-containing protein [Melanogaster broomeanus]|nr:RNA polymerase II transcription elongation factor-domain-containing protein [Melanogaster broomeanus]
MASADTQWMPVAGRHRVDIGTSLGRALKARKGIAPPKRASNLPDRDFYSFRYNFKPESIDPDKPGSIEVKRGKESTSVTVERPSTQTGESHLFKGTEQPVKEYDCVLIYDEELGTFTLEKLDSFMSFSFDRKVQTSASSLLRDTASPLAPPPQPDRANIELEEELERDLVGLEDADGDPEDDFEEVLATVTSGRKELPVAPTKVPPSSLPPKAKPPRSTPPKKQESLPKSKPKSKEVKRVKREADTRDLVDSDLEEVLDFGVPARQTKRRKSSPPTPKLPATRLALPDASTSVVLPSSRPVPPTREDSDSEDDWDAVVGDDAPADNDAEEIDLDALQQEMEQQLERSDEDILAAAMSPEPATNTPGRPMSLNQFAGGQLSADEDSTSSSEDSDDD